MSSDDEELAALRAARVARGGGLTVTAQRQAAVGGRENGGVGGEEESEEEEGNGGGIDAGAGAGDDQQLRPPPSFRPPPLVLPDDDDDDGMAAAGLPMSFGGGGLPSAAAAAAAAAARPPPAFQKKRPRDEEEEEEKEKGGADSGEEDSDDDEEGLPGPFRLPVSRSALFEPCERGVTALALDRAGSRLACGSRDGRVRLFDFGGARSDLKPFRTFFPLSGGGGGDGAGGGGDGEGAGATPPVVSLCWLPGKGGNEAGAAAGGGGGNESGGGGGGGALLLVACADARLVLCDREGRKLCESARGDGYLADPKNTAGHTAPLTSCCCLFGGGGGSGAGGSAPPSSSSSSSLKKPSPSPAAAPPLARVASGSEDGTVRLWAVLHDSERDSFSLKQEVVIKVPSAPGFGGGNSNSNRRTKVSALAFLSSSSSAAASSSPQQKNPSLLVAGTDDGAIHAWDPRARKGRPAAAGAVVTGPTARLMGLSARQKDWSFVSGASTSTTRSVFGAHGGGDSSSSCPRVTALAPPPAHLDDGASVASRGEDGTLKLWDLSEKSKAKKLPLVWSAGRGESASSSSSSSSRALSLPAEEPTTGLAWSPDGRVIATGTAEGTVAFLEAEAGGGGGSGKGGSGGALARSVSVADRIKKGDKASAPSAPSSSSSSSTCSVVPICWHPKLNQLLVGVSDPSAAKLKLGGRVVALFSPKLSERGVLLALSRTKKMKRHEDGAVALSEAGPGEIYNPHALPLYRAERSAGIPLAATGGSSRRSKDEEAAAAAARSAAHLPGRGGGGPALGAGSGGRLGVTGGTLLTQHVLKSRGGFGLVAPSEEGDIRERMLAHGDLAKKDPGMAALTSAYRETQPERVFQKGGGKEGGGEEGEEEEEEEDE